MSNPMDILDDGTLVSDADQYLTILLAGETYAVPILKIQEIKGIGTITPVPNAPSFVKGVMNLRGTVVPVLDMREKFGLARGEYDKFTVTVVVTVGARIVGLVVDAVSDVLNVTPADIVPVPELADGVDTSFLTGMAKVGESIVSLLDIEKVVGGAAHLAQAA